jgi:hypothetical protein
MSILNEILGTINNIFALMGIIDTITVIILLLANWNGLISGNATILGVVVLGLMNFLVGAIYSEIVESLIKGIVTAVMTVVEGIAKAIEAIFSAFR